jgi:hypothetical protein
MRKWKIFNNILLTLVIFTIFLLILVHLPPKRTIFQSKITNDLIGTYDLQVSIPQVIWFGKNEKIFLEFSQILTSKRPNSATNTELINLEIDFILTGGNIRPQGILVTQLIQNDEIQFDWKISAENYDEIPGSIRVSINPNSALHFSNQERELIFSKDFSVKVVNVLNIRFNWIQAILFLQLLIFIGLFFYTNFKKKSHTQE